MWVQRRACYTPLTCPAQCLNHGEANLLSCLLEFELDSKNNPYYWERFFPKTAKLLVSPWWLLSSALPAVLWLQCPHRGPNGPSPHWTHQAWPPCLASYDLLLATFSHDKTYPTVAPSFRAVPELSDRQFTLLGPRFEVVLNNHVAWFASVTVQWNRQVCIYY